MNAVVETHRWTRQQYEHMVRTGVFEPDQRVELIEGDVIKMVPQNAPHAVAVSLIDNLMRRAFGEGYTIRPQSPLSLGAYSQPEPDIAVVIGSPRDFVASHPQTAVLVVEISSSSLSYDRSTKLALYAKHDLPLVWIVNLIDENLEIYEQPSGTEFSRKRILKRGENFAVGPANTTFRVDDLLP